MALYELRTYTLRVGAMAEAVKLYQEVGFRRFTRASMIKSWSGTSRPIPERSTRFCIFGSSTMMQIDARIGPPSMRTRTLSRASR
jgi:hypothetical protein